VPLTKLERAKVQAASRRTNEDDDNDDDDDDDGSSHSKNQDELDLTNLTVRAYFDAPRIILGKRGRFFNIQLGPSTSVVLDATYVDDKIRIGKGGTSGTRFVFSRCNDDDREATEFLALLKRRPTSKSKLLTMLGLLGTSGISLIATGSKAVGGAVAVVSALSALAVTYSSGGVEDDGQQDFVEDVMGSNDDDDDDKE